MNNVTRMPSSGAGTLAKSVCGAGAAITLLLSGRTGGHRVIARMFCSSSLPLMGQPRRPGLQSRRDARCRCSSLGAGMRLIAAAAGVSSPCRTSVLIIAGESPAAESSAVVVIPANRSELGSCGAVMAVSIALASDITAFCRPGTARPEFFPRLPVTTRPGTPDLRSPNPWEVGEAPFGADTISER